MHKCLVSLSGGQDSATVLASAIKEFNEVTAASFNYGQRHDIELHCAHMLAKHFNVKHIVIDIPGAVTAPSALTTGLPFTINSQTSLPSSYVPGRNLIFSSILVSQAAGMGYTHVGLGVNAVDWSGYPDCTPEFFQALQHAVNIGVVPPVKFYTPLINLNKVDIIRLGDSLKVPWDITWTCYDPKYSYINGRSQVRPCMECFACKIRLATFDTLETTDPLVEKGGLKLE